MASSASRVASSAGNIISIFSSATAMSSGVPNWPIAAGAPVNALLNITFLLMFSSRCGTRRARRKPDNFLRPVSRLIGRDDILCNTHIEFDVFRPVSGANQQGTCLKTRAYLMLESYSG